MASSSSSSSAPSKGPAGGWSCVHFRPGEKGLELRRELEEIFTEQECGGLECRTCGFALSAADLLDGKEKNGGVGALGTMSSHRDSKQHKAAEDSLKKANESPKKVCRCI